MRWQGPQGQRKQLPAALWVLLMPAPKPWMPSAGEQHSWGECPLPRPQQSRKGALSRYVPKCERAGETWWAVLLPQCPSSWCQTAGPHACPPQESGTLPPSQQGRLPRKRVPGSSRAACSSLWLPSGQGSAKDCWEGVQKAEAFLGGRGEGRTTKLCARGEEDSSKLQMSGSSQLSANTPDPLPGEVAPAHTTWATSRAASLFQQACFHAGQRSMGMHQEEPRHTQCASPLKALQGCSSEQWDRPRGSSCHRCLQTPLRALPGELHLPLSRPPKPAGRPSRTTPSPPHLRCVPSRTQAWGPEQPPHTALSACVRMSAPP